MGIRGDSMIMLKKNIIFFIVMLILSVSTACHRSQVDSTPVAQEPEPVIIPEPPKDPWLNVKHAASEVIDYYLKKKDIKKYRIHGRIIEGAEGILLVFGSSYPVGGKFKKGYDQCTHYSSNIAIVLPEDDGVWANMYYQGEHCCFPGLVDSGTNAFGASVSIYSFGPCEEELSYKYSRQRFSKELADYEGEIVKRDYKKTEFSEITEKYFAALKNKDTKSANALCCSDTLNKMQRITKSLVSYVIPPELIDTDETMTIVYSKQKPSDPYKIKLYKIDYGSIGPGQACISFVDNAGEFDWQR